MDARQTETLDQAGAEALLMALREPLKWHRTEEEERIDGRSGAVTIPAVRWSSQSGFCTFDVHGTADGDKVWLSENGEEMPWLLVAKKKANRQSGVQRNGWQFPCRTAQEAKQICERFVWTENSTELDRLEVCRNPLQWGNHFNSEIAYVRRNAEDTAKYTVQPRIQWSIRHFRAYYEVDPYNSSHAKHLAAFLRRFNLPPTSTSPHNYATADEAKAACEHHLTTGQWSRGTLPRFLDKKAKEVK